LHKTPGVGGTLSPKSRQKPRLGYTLLSGGSLGSRQSILLILTALFPIVNPLGGSPVFLALTRDYPPPLRRILARQVALNSFILLIASFLIGTHILHFFGISIPVVQVRRRPDRHFQWLDHAEKQRGNGPRPGRPGKSESQRCFSQRLLSSHSPAYCWTGLHLHGHHACANEPHHLGPNLLAILAAVIGSALVAVSIYLCYGFSDRLAAFIAKSGMASSCGFLPFFSFASASRSFGTVRAPCTISSRWSLSDARANW